MQFLSCNKGKKITLPSTRIHKYIPFVDLEKALIMFRVVGLDFINNKGYESAESKIGTNNEFSYKFPVNVGVHRGSISLLSIVVPEALSREFRAGCPQELLYVDDDQTIIYKSLDMI